MFKIKYSEFQRCANKFEDSVRYWKTTKGNNMYYPPYFGIYCKEGKVYFHSHELHHNLYVFFKLEHTGDAFSDCLFLIPKAMSELFPRIGDCWLTFEIVDGNLVAAVEETFDEKHLVHIPAGEVSVPFDPWDSFRSFEPFTAILDGGVEISMTRADLMKEIAIAYKFMAQPHPERINGLMIEVPSTDITFSVTNARVISRRKPLKVPHTRGIPWADCGTILREPVIKCLHELTKIPEMKKSKIHVLFDKTGRSIIYSDCGRLWMTAKWEFWKLRFQDKASQDNLEKNTNFQPFEFNTKELLQLLQAINKENPEKSHTSSLVYKSDGGAFIFEAKDNSKFTTREITPTKMWDNPLPVSIRANLFDMIKIVEEVKTEFVRLWAPIQTAMQFYKITPVEYLDSAQYINTLIIDPPTYE